MNTSLIMMTLEDTIAKAAAYMKRKHVDDEGVTFEPEHILPMYFGADTEYATLYQALVATFVEDESRWEDIAYVDTSSVDTHAAVLALCVAGAAVHAPDQVPGLLSFALHPDLFEEFDMRFLRILSLMNDGNLDYVDMLNKQRDRLETYRNLARVGILDTDVESVSNLKPIATPLQVIYNSRNKNKTSVGFAALDGAIKANNAMKELGYLGYVERETRTKVTKLHTLFVSNAHNSRVADGTLKISLGTMKALYKKYCAPTAQELKALDKAMTKLTTDGRLRAKLSCVFQIKHGVTLSKGVYTSTYSIAPTPASANPARPNEALVEFTGAWYATKPKGYENNKIWNPRSEGMRPFMRKIAPLLSMSLNLNEIAEHITILKESMRDTQQAADKFLTQRAIELMQADDAKVSQAETPVSDTETNNNAAEIRVGAAGEEVSK